MNPGKNYLLLIGINQYVHNPPLENAVGDAKAFKELLLKYYEFESAQVFELYDQEATENGIIDALFQMMELITPDDSLVVYFSGHGHYDLRLEEGYWVPVEADIRYINQMIPYSTLVQMIRAIKGKHIALIVDSCYAGAVLVRSAAKRRLERLRSRWLLASGRNEVVLDGTAGDGSPFAKQLFHIMEAHADEGIRFGTLVNLLITAVSYNSPQTPIGRPLSNAGDSGGEFVFYPKGHSQQKGAINIQEVLPDPEAFQQDHLWRNARSLDTLDLMRSYLTDNPDGEHVSLAKEKIATLSDSVPMSQSPIFPAMRTIAEGDYHRGSLTFRREQPVHRVYMNAFSIGKYPVTFEEYDAYCAITQLPQPKDKGWGRGWRPVIHVSWYDAIRYCNWLSEVEGLYPFYQIGRNDHVVYNLSSQGYRLPFESEWEYAAKGGVRSKDWPFAGHQDINQVAWHTGNADQMTHPVGQLLPNELDLNDMSGNVYEWCSDIWNHRAYKIFTEMPARHPTGPKDGIRRVGRGGGYRSEAAYCRVTYREDFDPYSTSSVMGFRIAKGAIE